MAPGSPNAGDDRRARAACSARGARRPAGRRDGDRQVAVVARATDVAEARNYLVDQRQVARPLIVQLLSDDDAQVRMNAAIVLAQMAAAGDTSAATLQALQIAAKDKEFSVAYWGFQGLMSDGVPATDQSMVINEMMKMERPRALRLAALTTIGDKKPISAAPIIVSHLQEILKEYKAQVETVVTSSETLPAPARGSAAAFHGAGARRSRPGGLPRRTRSRRLPALHRLRHRRRQEGARTGAPITRGPGANYGSRGFRGRDPEGVPGAGVGADSCRAIRRVHPRRAQ